MNRYSTGLFCRVVLMVIAVISMTAMQTVAVELNVARQGEVKNVPLQAPYNGCLIVREGPGMDYPVKGHVVNGDTVTIEATSGSWYKITAPLSGYIWSSYVTITDSQTIETSNMTTPLDLETIVNNSDPWTRAQKLPERQQLLENNKVFEINIEQEIAP
ncbi:MAG TPA: hypothetical protein DCG57_21275 [Candidatus Riflebacteria bacterium]|nr:hypothetical protein [Candidatus Riflebacteria bacterium]